MIGKEWPTRGRKLPFIAGSPSFSAEKLDEPYWTYEDIGAFFFVLAFLNTVVRAAIRLHLLRSAEFVVHNPIVQSLILIFLGGALYAILKLRYRQPVLAPLGWRIPTRIYSAIAILGGTITALAITHLTQLSGQRTPAIPAKEFLFVGVFLGPILEESVFRGCMLPLLTRTLGNALSVGAIAVLFAAFHAPGDVTHWVWFTATGAAYGSLRLASETTTAAAFMHATCNLTLFLSAKL